MAQSSPAYTRLRQDSDEERASSVTSEEVKPPEPPPAPVAAEMQEKVPEEAPPVQSGFQPAVPTAMPPGYQPAVFTPGYQPAVFTPGYPIPPAGPAPVAATSVNPTTVMQTQPGVGMAVLYPQNKPKDYLVLSVFSMLCCCFIFGLIGLIYSLRVNSSWNAGDYDDARRSSQSAKNWNTAAIITGGVVAALAGISVLVQLVVLFNSRNNYN